MIKKYLPILILIGTFLVPNFAHGASLSQLTNNKTLYLANGSAGIMQTFSGDSLIAAGINSISDITIHFNATTPDYYIAGNSYLSEVHGSYANCPIFPSVASTFNGQTSGIHGDLSAGNYVFHWNTPFSIQSGKVYKFWFSQGNNGYAFNVAGSTANTYSGGKVEWTANYRGCMDYNYGCYTTTCTNSGDPADLYFIVSNGSPDISIAFYNPQAGQTKTADFSNWVMNAVALPEYTGSDYYRIEVDHGSSSSSPAYADVYYTHGGSGQFSFAKSLPLTFLDNGKWYASAILQNKNNTTIATAAQIAFTLNITNPNSANFYTPANGATITTDFPSWVINATTTPAYTGDDYRRYAIAYERDNNGTIYIDEYYTQAAGNGAQYGFGKTNALTDGSWEADLAVFDKDNNQVASSTSSFTVALGGGSGKPIGSCEGGNWVGDKFCEVMLYLFVPDDGSLNQFNSLFSVLSDKVPFGWFTGVRSAILGINMPSEGAYEIAFTEVEGFLTDFAAPLRNGLIILFWLMFAFWVVRKISSFDFK